MSTQQAPPRVPRDEQAPTRRYVMAVVVAAVIIIAGAVILANVFQKSEVAIPDDADPFTLAGLWVDAFNDGDLETALAILSPEASCDLPIPTSTYVESCEEHLGYLIAIGSHLETELCQSAPPFRCSYGLTSGFHAAFGYPDFSLPMNTVYTLDGDGRLVADFFGSIDPSHPYWPTEGANLWAFMKPVYPELDIDLTFGPDPYNARAGEAVMEAIVEFNGAARIAGLAQEAFDIYSPSDFQQCTANAGEGTCRHLVDFLEGINAQLELDCDPDSGGNGTITCPLSFDSDLNRELGGGPSTGEATITYRGGKPRGLVLEWRFATDQTVHDDFMAYATTVDGTHADGSPVFDGDTAGAWLAAAADFASR